MSEHSPGETCAEADADRERLYAKLAEVKRERDDWRSAYGEARQTIEELRAQRDIAAARLSAHMETFAELEDAFEQLRAEVALIMKGTNL